MDRGAVVVNEFSYRAQHCWNRSRNASDEARFLRAHLEVLDGALRMVPGAGCRVLHMTINLVVSRTAESAIQQGRRSLQTGHFTVHPVAPSRPTQVIARLQMSCPAVMPFSVRRRPVVSTEPHSLGTGEQPYRDYRRLPRYAVRPAVATRLGWQWQPGSAGDNHPLLHHRRAEQTRQRRLNPACPLAANPQCWAPLLSSANLILAARRTSAATCSHGHAPTRTNHFVLPGGPLRDFASFVCRADWHCPSRFAG